MSGENTFFQCLKKGKIGERLLLQKYPSLSDNTNVDETLPDIRSPCGRFIEVKYDSSKKARRSADGLQTNILFERYKNVANRSLGGPWRAELDGAELFVVIFEHPLQFYYFRTSLLVSRLDELRRDGRMRLFGRHNTFKMNKCYLCPKTLVDDLLLTEEEFRGLL